MDNKKDIPLILAMDEAEKKLVNTVNEVLADYKLPSYLLEMIIDKIHYQLRDSAKTELVTVKNEYARKCAEKQKTEGGGKT